MSISIQCTDCGQLIVCQAGTVKVGSLLTCAACGHSFECRGRELRAALRNVEKSIQDVACLLQDAALKEKMITD